ncbi:PucR family transcriptional regulator [Nocardioides alkalitolerans]|uniref:PucR family transcriptional regulator n=1 Tax=Nocardioides alkalitolerans TaxID=281714 RepID=UPI00048E710E|nr:helix-turn-helix domain-containing protein [Nocardioides alkalitolerans]
MATRDLQRVVDQLAEHLQRSVVLDDPDITLIAASRHYGDQDEQRIRAVLQRDVGSPAIAHILDQGVLRWTSPGVIPARDDIGMGRRHAMPVRWRGQVLGLLIVIDADASMDAGEVARLAQAADELATLLYREQIADDRERAATEELVRQLLASGAEARHEAGRVLVERGYLKAGRWFSVLTAEVTHAEGGVHPGTVTALRVAAEGVLRGRPSTGAYAVDGHRLALVQVWSQTEVAPHLRRQAETLRDTIAPLLEQGGDVVVGIGPAVADLDDCARAGRGAVLATRAAARVPAFGGLASYDDLGGYVPLLAVPPETLTEELVPAGLLRLRAADRGGKLVPTLRCFLAHGGNVGEAATELHLHRTSLYYRLERIAEITGSPLDSGEVRLALHQGLLVLDLLG